MVSALSPAYQSWMNDAFGDLFPDERRSTCHDCAMCHAWEPAPAMVPEYLPALKCCTYFPNLTNFLVGRVLRDPDTAEGAARLRAAITRRAATPLGVHPSPSHTARYSARAMRFGRDEALRCPYLDGDKCSVWRHRNSVCQTFFCKIDGGVPAASVWTSLAGLLMLVEDKLAVHHVATLLGHPDGLRRMFGEHGQRVRISEGELAGVGGDGALEPALYAALWGPYAGREEAFFAACADQTDALTWDDVLQIGGPAVRALSEELRVRLAAREGGPPKRLRLAVIGVDVTWDETVTGDLAAAVPAILNDPMIVPRATWDALAEDAEGAIAALSDAERDRLWRGGLLVPGVAAHEERPLRPDDKLFAGRCRKYEESITFDGEGRAVVTISAGAAELTFDEPELLAFARALFANRAGFSVADALVWSDAPEEKVLETLHTLVGMEILERA